MFREFLRYLSLELYRSPHTVESYDADLRGFNRYMSQTGVIMDDAGCFIPSRIETGHIRGWIATMAEEGVSPRSIRRKLQSLRSYFKFECKRNPGLVNPLVGLKIPKVSKRLPEFARDTELGDLLSQISDGRDRLIVMMLYGCGLRRAELLSLTDGDIMHSRGEIRVTGKGNKTRVIPMPGELSQAIREYQRERDSEFPDLRSPKPLIATSHGQMSESNLYKRVRKILASTTASKKSPHTLRHTFATTLLNSGADINSVKELLGHSSLGATQIYTHVAFKDMHRDWQKAHPRSKKREKE